MRYAIDVTNIIIVFAFLIFPGTHLLAQTSYDAKDRIYEKEKCEKSESGHFHERTDGGDVCEHDSEHKKGSNRNSQKSNENKSTEKNISNPSKPSTTKY